MEKSPPVSPDIGTNQNLNLPIARSQELSGQLPQVVQQLPDRLDGPQIIAATPPVAETQRGHGEEGYYNLSEIGGELKDTAGLALSGLRLAVKTIRRQMAFDRTRELKTKGARRHEQAQAVLEGRLPKSGFEPSTRGEQRGSIRTARKRTRIMRRNANSLRLQAVFGYEDASGRQLESGYYGPDNNVIREPTNRIRRNHDRWIGTHPDDKPSARQLERLRVKIKDPVTGEESEETHIGFDYSRPFPRFDIERTFHKARADAIKAKNYGYDESQDAVQVVNNDLGTKKQRLRLKSGGYSGGRRRAERIAGLQFNADQRFVGKELHEFGEIIDGKDVPGVINGARAVINEGTGKRVSGQIVDLREKREQQKAKRAANRIVRKDAMQQRKIIRNAAIARTFNRLKDNYRPSHVKAAYQEGRNGTYSRRGRAQHRVKNPVARRAGRAWSKISRTPH